MDLGLRGKVALVTAASKGMGKACALEFAREGAKVAMCARTESDLKTAADEVRAATKADVLAIPADVTKKDDVQALTQRVSSQWGGVDILVANAGGPARGFFEEVSDGSRPSSFRCCPSCAWCAGCCRECRRRSGAGYSRSSPCRSSSRCPISCCPTPCAPARTA